MDAFALQEYLHRHIPVSQAMGITVVSASHEMIVLRAALAPNLNHRSTAFGGSVASLAVLAGWSLLRLGLDSFTPTPQIVIQRSTMDYTAPINADFTATCRRPEDAAWQRFLRAFERRGRGRLVVQVDVTAEDRPSASLEAGFVALRS
ncbi:MAG: YiiD C-terminal domain-containing protein [Longimicrobiales bacterium]